MSESKELKKFPPDRNLSTWKESATHRRAQTASNRHSINRNKYVEGQFYIKRFVPGRKKVPAIHQPSIQTSFLTCGWMHALATFIQVCLPSFQTRFLLPGWTHAPRPGTCRPSRQDFFSPDGRTRRTPAAFNAISRRRLILHRNLKTNF